MRQLALELAAHRYNIYIGDGLINNRELLVNYCDGDNVLILTNETIAPLYLERLKACLPQKKVYPFILPDGERYKNLTSYSAVLDFLIEHQFRRNDTLIALGGGVIGDLGGFVAASYQRGMGLIQVPTSLLAQVDSSVGGKTAVNHVQGKNMIGAFYQPKAVIIDTDTLASLPEREYISGFAEIVKYAFLGERDLGELLQSKIDEIKARDRLTLAEIIYLSCQKKAAVVSADEKEKGERALLNLGHSFAHALENLTHYKHYLHGEAVAIGMAMAINLAQSKEMLSKVTADNYRNLMIRLKLPDKVQVEMTQTDILNAMKLDKKNINQNYRLVLPVESGCVIVEENDSALMKQAIAQQLENGNLIQ